MLLVSPLVWLHYLPLLVIPSVQLASLLSHGYHLSLAAVAMLLSYALIFIFYPIADSLPRHGVPELLSEYAVAAVLLLYCATQVPCEVSRRDLAAGGSCLVKLCY